MDNQDKLAGLASLGLIETLLAVLVERKVLSKEEVEEIFLDTADAFDASVDDGGAEENEAVARLLEKVQAGNDTVRWN